MKRPGFTYGWCLGLLEMLGTCTFSFAERACKAQRGGRSTSAADSGTPFAGACKHRSTAVDYAVVCACLMGSSSLSNIALNYISFPTKVVFRSCKLIPTMAIAVLMHRKAFATAEWAAAAAVCAGLVLVGASDAWTLGVDFHPIGLGLVSASVVADAIMPNVQQRLFARGEGRADVIFFSNLVVSAWMLASTALSGDLAGALGVAAQDPTCAAYMAVYACVAYVAISFHMSVVQRFGGVVGVLVGNGRKIVTIVISFVAFPKPVTGSYLTGVMLSLGGLAAAVLLRDDAQRRGGGSDGRPKATEEALGARAGATANGKAPALAASSMV